MPGLVRASFLVFAIVLVLVGTALIMRYPAVFPWPLQPQSSVVSGWVFLGAAMYFFVWIFASGLEQCLWATVRFPGL